MIGRPHIMHIAAFGVFALASGPVLAKGGCAMWVRMSEPQSTRELMSDKPLVSNQEEFMDSEPLIRPQEKSKQREGRKSWGYRSGDSRADDREVNDNERNKSGQQTRSPHAPDKRDQVGDARTRHDCALEVVAKVKAAKLAGARNKDAVFWWVNNAGGGYGPNLVATLCFNSSLVGIFTTHNSGNSKDACRIAARFKKILAYDGK